MCLSCSLLCPPRPWPQQQQGEHCSLSAWAPWPFLQSVTYCHQLEAHGSFPRGVGSEFLAPRRLLSRPLKLLVLATLIPVVLQWVLQPTLSPPLHSTTRPKLHLVPYKGLDLGRLQTRCLSCPQRLLLHTVTLAFQLVRPKAWSHSRLPSFSSTPHPVP